MRLAPAFVILGFGLFISTASRGDLFEHEWIRLKERWKNCGYQVQAVDSVPQLGLREHFQDLKGDMLSSAAQHEVPSERIVELAEEFEAGRAEAREDGWIGEKYNQEIDEEDLKETIEGMKENYDICIESSY